MQLYTILQLTRGYSSRVLEVFFRTSFKQICNWADRFDAEGLSIKAGRGRRFRLTVEQQHQLKAELSKSPKELGYNADRWSDPLTREHIRKMYQVEYKQAAVYNLMRRMGLYV